MPHPPRPSTRRAGGRFVVTAAALALLVPAIGFGRSFVVPWIRSQLAPSALLVTHAAAFFAWVVLLLVQVLLVRGRRVDIHRRLGRAGLGLIALMLVTGVAVAVDSTARALAGGHQAAAGFLLKLLLEVGLFAALAGVGLAARGHPAAHRRLMLLATSALMPAASARIPLLVDHPIAVMTALVAALAAFDLAATRRLHPATLGGGGAVLGSQLVWHPLGETAAWQAAAAWSLRALDLLPGR